LFETEILSLDGKAFCVSGGFQITPDGSFMDVEQTDLIVIPPFLPNVELLPAMKTAAPSVNYSKNTPACHLWNTGINLNGGRIRQEIGRARTYRRDYTNRTVSLFYGITR